MGYRRSALGETASPATRPCITTFAAIADRPGPSPTRRTPTRRGRGPRLKVGEGRLNDPRRGTADLPPLRHRGVAASPRHRGEHPGGLHLPDRQAHPAVVRSDADERDHAQPRPRVGHRPAGQGREPGDHPEGPLHPQRDLHHRPGRRHLPAPVQGRQDAHRPEEASQDHHPGAVRRDLRRAARRTVCGCSSRPTSRPACDGES